MSILTNPCGAGVDATGVPAAWFWQGGPVVASPVHRDQVSNARRLAMPTFVDNIRSSGAGLLE